MFCDLLALKVRRPCSLFSWKGRFVRCWCYKIMGIGIPVTQKCSPWHWVLGFSARGHALNLHIAISSFARRMIWSRERRPWSRARRRFRIVCDGRGAGPMMGECSSHSSALRAVLLARLWAVLLARRASDSACLAASSAYSAMCMASAAAWVSFWSTWSTNSRSLRSSSRSSFRFCFNNCITYMVPAWAGSSGE